MNDRVRAIMTKVDTDIMALFDRAIELAEASA